MSAVSVPHGDLSAILKRINIDGSIKDYFKVRVGICITTAGDAFPPYFKEMKVKIQMFLGILSAFSCGSHLLYRGFVG